MNDSYIYIYHVNVTQTVPDISPLMPMHQDPLLVYNVCQPDLQQQTPVTFTCLHTLYTKAETKWPYFADGNLKCIILNENVKILNEIQLKCVPGGSTHSKSALVQVTVWQLIKKQVITWTKFDQGVLGCKEWTAVLCIFQEHKKFPCSEC